MARRIARDRTGAAEKVTTAPDIVVAALIKGRLEEAGIPVMLRSHGAAGWLFPGTPGSGGAMDLLVPRVRADEAREIVAALEAGREGPGERPAEQDLPSSAERDVGPEGRPVPGGGKPA